MKFAITIDGKKHEAGYTGYTARIFREQFGKDLFKEIQSAEANMIYAHSQAKEKGLDVKNTALFLGLIVETVTPELLEKLCWCALATGERLKGNLSFPLFNEWLDQIDNYNDMLMTGASVFLIVSGIVTTVEMNTAEDDKKKA